MIGPRVCAVAPPQNASHTLTRGFANENACDRALHRTHPQHPDAPTTQHRPTHTRDGAMGGDGAHGTWCGSGSAVGAEAVAKGDVEVGRVGGRKVGCGRWVTRGGYLVGAVRVGTKAGEEVGSGASGGACRPHHPGGPDTCLVLFGI